jgi:mono/diheme cytochrome c family protein
MLRNLHAAMAGVAMVLGVSSARADESSVQLTQADGVERVQAYCAICHSLDYIVMNSPFQDRAGWDKTVTKMVKVMGAPLAPEDAAAVIDYLAANYGKPQ